MRDESTLVLCSIGMGHAGCVMSPHLFSAVLEWAMRDWKAHGRGLGIVLQENQNPLVDLTFADDVLMFAASVEQSLDMLRCLVDALRKVGPILNVSKTKLLTTQAQPPDHLWLDVQTKIDVLLTSHRWLGCCLGLPEDQDVDVELHLTAPACAFWAYKWILCDKHVPVELRIEYFEAVVTPVACFGAGHRKIYQHQLHKFDVEWRRLLRTLLGPPPGLDWNMPWHQILHSWNRRVLDFSSETFQLQSWSETCLRQYWKFASGVASLPSSTWVRRALEWFPAGTPPITWCTQLESFVRVMGWEDWTAYAQHSRDWQHACDAFVNIAKQ